MANRNSSPLEGLRDLAVRTRRAAGVRGIETFVRTLSTVGRLLPQARPARHGVRVVRDLAYVDDNMAEHRLDVYQPPGAQGLRPVVLYVHGGGFNILSKDTHWMMGVELARRGYVVFNISYRLAPRHPFPAALVDGADALAWVVANAAAWGGDVGRLALAGESAGANIVTALTIGCCFERPERWARAVHALQLVPRAVVPGCGLLQVSDVERLVRGNPGMSLFVRDRLASVAAAYLGASAVAADERELADPLLVLEGAAPAVRPLPPFFVPVGGADPVLPDSERLVAALAARGVPASLRSYAGQPHAFFALVWRAAAAECWADIHAFLAEQLAERAAPAGDAGSPGAAG